MTVPTFEEIRQALKIPAVHEFEFPVMSRIEARLKGEKRYFTGNPCKNGHISERNALSGGCLACERSKYNLRRHTKYD